jgi:uncharacterized iron-regulated membrane protein
MNLTIIIPKWFLYVLTVTGFIYLANTVAGIYLHYLKLKLKGFRLSDNQKSLLWCIPLACSLYLLYTVGF